jgi:hypothetical protein
VSERPKLQWRLIADDEEGAALRVTVEVHQQRGRCIDQWPGQVVEVSFRSDQLPTPLALSQALEVACMVLDDQADDVVEMTIEELGVKSDPEQN